MTTQPIDYEALKKQGFLKQRQDGFLVLRTRMSRGAYGNDQLETLAVIAQKFGKGIIHATTRQGLEIPFIKFEDISKVEDLLGRAKIDTGTSGARLRVTTACPGNNWCSKGLVDTFSLAGRIENELGIVCGIDLPHKFKIAISGCPNMCTRCDASEIGIHGQVDTSAPDKRIGYAVYIGGCGGRTPHAGFKLERVYTEDEVLQLVKRVVQFFKENAKPRQRLASLIEERGVAYFLKNYA